MASKSFIFPASFAQQRLWFLEQLDPGKSVYNMLYGVRFETRLNLGALEHSLNEIVRRHESLRTTFSTKDEKPVQVIAKEMSVELPVIDLSGVSNSERERETRRWSEHEAEQTFDLAAGPNVCSASCSDQRLVSRSRSLLDTPLRSITGNSTLISLAMTCTGFSSLVENVVRNDSCRRTISFKLCSRAPRLRRVSKRTP